MRLDAVVLTVGEQEKEKNLVTSIDDQDREQGRHIIFPRC